MKKIILLPIVGFLVFCETAQAMKRKSHVRSNLVQAAHDAINNEDEWLLWLENENYRLTRARYIAGNKKHQCDVCVYTTSYAKRIDYHRKVHETVNTSPETKIYSCDIQGCGYLTTIKRSFKEHDNIHQDIKQFSCSFPGCRSRFTFEGRLQRHIKNKH